MAGPFRSAAGGVQGGQAHCLRPSGGWGEVEGAPPAGGRHSRCFTCMNCPEPREPSPESLRAHSDTAGRRSSACVRAVCGGSGCSTQARLRFRLPSAQRPTSSPPPPRPPLRRRQAPAPSAPPFAAAWSSPESSFLWPREAQQPHPHARPAKASDIRHSNPRCSCLRLSQSDFWRCLTANATHRTAPHPHRSTRDHQHLARAHLPLAHLL